MDQFCIGPFAWSLGRNLSVDEMTIWCKGSHCDILCITYKNEGDGFQSDDALCQEGFCFVIINTSRGMNHHPASILVKGIHHFSSRYYCGCLIV